jgi:HlyD family secretion protein
LAHYILHTQQRHTSRAGRVLHTKYNYLALLILGASLLAGCAGLRGAPPTPTVAVAAYEPGAGIAQTATPTPAGETPVENNRAPAVPAVGESTAQTVAQNAQTLAPVGVNTYTGNVVAEDEIGVAVEVIGQVLKINVSVGDTVKAGDVLLEINKTSLEARRAQALAGLEAAQAQLDLLLEEPSEEDLEAARAGVAAAEAAYRRALEGPTEEDLRAAEAQLRQAEAVVAQAQAAYDQVKNFPNVGALPQSLQLQQATLQLEAAQAQYDKLVKGATEDVIAAAYSQLSQARARLATLEQGPRDGQVRAQEALVRQAETSLYLAQLELDKATVRAPIDGVIVSVDTAVGTQVAPGAPVFRIQTNTVKVEIAVEEVRLPELRIGRPAAIRVNAYPDRIFEGEVALIAPVLDPATRTVKTTIRPTGDAADLRPGMFASVELR